MEDIESLKSLDLKGLKFLCDKYAVKIRDERFYSLLLVIQKRLVPRIGGKGLTNSSSNTNVTEKNLKSRSKSLELGPTSASLYPRSHSF